MKKMEQLYEEPKMLLEDIEWETNEQNPERQSVRLEVRGLESDEISSVKGDTWGADEYGFSFMYRNKIIRQWDFTEHDDLGPHKHTYKNVVGIETETYEVNDVTTSDPHAGLIDFLAECNISAGPYATDRQTTLDEVTENGL